MSFATNRAEHTEFAYFCILSNLAITVSFYLLGYPVGLISFFLDNRKVINPKKILTILLVAYLNIVGGAIYPDLDIKTYRQAMLNRAIVAPMIGNLFYYWWWVESRFINYIIVFFPLIVYHLQILLNRANLVGGHRNSLLHNKIFWFSWFSASLFTKNTFLLTTVTMLSFGAITHLLLDLIGSEFCLKPGRLIIVIPKAIVGYVLMGVCWIGLISLPFQ